MYKTKDSTKQEAKSPDDLDHKLLTYSIVAGAALALGHPPAEAAVQYTPYGLPNIGISGTSLNLNLDGDGVNDFNFSISINTFGNMGSSTGSYYGTQNYARVNGATGANRIRLFGSQAHLFDAGNLIQFGGGVQTTTLAMLKQETFGTWTGNSTFYVTNNITTSSGPLLGNRGFLGARFDIAGSPHMAWIDVAVNADVSLITVFGWAFEDVANTAIAAGDQGPPTPVPLPAAGALFSLALGAGALMERRRRQKLVKDKLPRTAQ